MDKSKEELIKELQDLQNKYNSIISLYEKDINGHKQTETALKKSQLLLNETGKISKVGGWEFDVKTFEQIWTEEIFNILEIDISHGTPKVEQGIQFFAPSSKQIAEQAVQRAIEFGEPYDLEVEIITTKKNYRWVRTIGKANYDNGKIISVSGIFQDITERKQAEILKQRNIDIENENEKIKQLNSALKIAIEKAEESEEKFKAVVENGAVLMTITDTQGKVIFASPQCEKVIGWPITDIIGLNMPDFIHPDDKEMVVAERGKVNAMQTSKEFEYRIFDKQKKIRWISHSTTFIKNGDAFCILSTITNITDFKQTENELIQAKSFLLEAERIANMGSWDWNFKTNKTYWSNQLFNIYGRNKEEGVPSIENYLQQYHPEDRIKVQNAIQKAIEEKAPYFIEYRIFRYNDGKEVVIQSKGEIILDHNGNPERLLGIAIDITKQKLADSEIIKAKEEAEESSVRLQIAHDASGAGAWDWDIVKNTFFWSAEFLKIFGLPDETIAGFEAWKKVLHPDDLEIAGQRIQDSIFNHTELQSDYRVILPDNTIRWIRAFGKTIYEGNNPIRMVGLCLDISSHKNAEQELIKAKEKAEVSEARYRIIADNTTDSIWVMDADFRFTYLSPATEQLFGYSLPEWETLDWSTFVSPDYIEIVHNAFGKLKSENEEKLDPLSVAVRHKNGTEMWVEFSANALYDKDNVMTSVVGITRNITERKRFELELAEITEEAITLKQSLDLVDGFAFTKGIDLKYVSASHSFCDLSKIPYNRVKGLTDYDIFPPDLAEKYMADDKRVIETAEPITVEEETINSNTNQRIILQTRKFPLFNKSRCVIGVYGMAYDITELKKAEYALRRSEAIKNKIVSNINDVIVIIDQNGINQYKSPNINKLFGWKPEELIGKATWDTIHPDDLVEGQKFFGTILTKPNASGLTEMRYKHKDGHYVWIEINVINLLHDNDIQGVLGNYHDISERKTAEKQLIVAKAKAEESDRLKTTFLQNMSHEIRTPMNAIMGFSELLARNYGDKLKLEYYSKIINQRCNDLLVIIEDVLDISKIESGQLSVTIEKCNVNSLFSELKLFFMEQQQKLKKQHIKFFFQAQCDQSKLYIETDIVKLKQIFINLIGNAFKFTDNGSIEGGCKFDNNNLIFYVSDTGIGIPNDKQKAIFERFIQVEHGARRTYGGTGLGLSIVKGLVHLLGGEIWLESEVGKGSTFYFSIPYKSALELTHEPIVIEEKSINTILQNKTILVVEDDIYNAEYIKEILSETGFNILYAQNGNEAVQIATTQPLDLVLMDIGLPDITGYEAIRQIKQLKPHLKIIAQTAYAASEDKRKAIEAGCIDYISKPLKTNMLLSIINKHLS